MPISGRVRHPLLTRLRRSSGSARASSDLPLGHADVSSPCFLVCMSRVCPSEAHLLLPRHMLSPDDLQHLSPLPWRPASQEGARSRVQLQTLLDTLSSGSFAKSLRGTISGVPGRGPQAEAAPSRAAPFFLFSLHLRYFLIHFISLRCLPHTMPAKALKMDLGAGICQGSLNI